MSETEQRPSHHGRCNRIYYGIPNSTPEQCTCGLDGLRIERDALAAENERLQRATRTRPDYDLRCSCGAPHWLDTSIPAEAWNKIASDEELLCLLCIDERLAALGLKVEANFYFAGRGLTDSTARLAAENKRLKEALREIEQYAEWREGDKAYPIARRALLSEEATE